MSSERFHAFHIRIIYLMTMLFVLSVLDGLFTLWGVRIGVIEEVNPLMKLLINRNQLGFMAVKFMLPTILSYFVWQLRNSLPKYILYSLGIVLSAYTLVIILHIYWIINMQFCI